MKKKFFICLVLLMSNHFLVSQTTFNVKKELERTVKIPNTPEAAAFQKYGDYTVSLYTGKPNISIPIYTFVGKEINLPVSLTYDASGIKVSQLASSAGLGWNLNVGGRVSRTVNGLVDDYLMSYNYPYTTLKDSDTDILLYGRNLGTINNFITSYLNPPSSFQSHQKAVDYFDFLRGISENKIETQPDFFSFNALGYSNTFVYDFSEANFIPLDNPREKVEVFYLMNGSISEFIVTTDNGVKLFFALAEKTRTESADINSNSTIVQEYNSSWLLTKIISQNGKDVYEFSYTDLGLSNTEPLYIGNTYTNTINGTQSEVIASGNLIYNETSYKNSQQILTQINYNGQPIIKINYKSRSDFNLNSAIDNIEILKFNTNNELKKIKFNHTYFGDTSSQNTFDKRLKLDNIQEVFGNNDTILKTYSFDYFSPSSVPPRNSYAKDYLGLYNGANNTVLYPQFNMGLYMLSGANRTPNFNNAIIGTLKKITYPTGGYTLFDYESNTSIEDFTEQSYTSSTYTQVYGSLSINGGIGNGNNCGTCCIDQYGNPPNINTTRFNINESGNYDINFSSIGIEGEAYLIQLSSIVKNTFPTAYLYDEIIDQSNCNELIPIKWSNLIGHNGDHIFLEQGAYQITLVKGNSSISNDSASLSVSREEITGNNSSTNYLVAGFRIKTIKSYQDINATEPSLEKEYKYTTAINSNVSSGVILNKPSFYKISEAIINNGGILETIQRLTRPSSIYAGGSTPHIAYAKVFEIEKNNTLNNGYVEHNFNLGIENGINNNGAVNFYSNNFSNGKPKEVKTYNTLGDVLDKEFTEYTNPIFNGKSTIYIYNNPNNSYNYIRIFKDYADGGKYKISYEPAFFFAFNSPTIGSSTPTANPPVTCNETRDVNNQLTNYCLPSLDYSTLETRKTYAQGKIGNIAFKSKYSYFNIDSVHTSSSYFYKQNIGYLLKEVKNITSNGDTLMTKMYYPKEVISVSSLGHENLTNDEKNAIQGLVTRNVLTLPVQTENFKNNTLLSTQRTNFISVGNKYLPKNIQTSKNNNSLEDRIVYHSYYNNGNPKEVSQKDGTHIVYIWGYKERHPVAKVENATYTQVAATLTASELSNIQNGTYDDVNMRDKLNKIRISLSNAQVTTFTYDPLIGVTSITDPRGETIYYHYDNFNRLEYVKDAQGKILSKNEYHYKN